MLIKKILKNTAFYPVHIGEYIRKLYFYNYLHRLPIKNITNVLDAGCGDGTYALWMAHAFPWLQVTGIDIMPPGFQGKKTQNCHFRYGDLTKLDDKYKYDFIYCIDVLEHIPGNFNVLKRMFNSLKPDGYLYIHMPTKDNQRMFPKRYFEEFDNRMSKEHIGEQYQQKEIIDILKSIGFNILLSKQTMGFYGKIAWEIDRIIDNQKSIKVLLMPILKILSHFELYAPKIGGNGILVIGKKPYNKNE
ncbi:MAG: class I SAM-dependent methyltransferase [Candidatus Omnitrophota bacterium]